MSTPKIEQELKINDVWGYMSRLGLPTRARGEAKFLAMNGFPRPEGDIPPREMEALDGLMLSDGHLAKQRGRNAEAFFAAGFSRRRTAESIRTALPFIGISKPVRTRKKKTGKIYELWQIHSHSLPQLTEEWKKWYQKRRKIVPLDILLTPTVLYWWYVGDGNLPKNGGIYFATQGFSKIDREFLVMKLQELKFDPRIHRSKKIYLPKKDRKGFFNLIGPCNNPEYSYKWPHMEKANV